MTVTAELAGFIAGLKYEHLPAATRERPDALLVRGRRQQLRVVVPASFDDAKKYPLLVDMDGALAPRDDALYVTPVGMPWHTERASGADIAEHLRAKYAIESVTITPEPAPKKKRRKHRHHHGSAS